MAQPVYNDTDFTSLNNHVFDVTVVTQAAGTYTINLDGGPYTGTGATETLVRDALKTSIDAGTHPNWTAADEGTDAIRITSLGPGQHVGGGPDFINPDVQAPVGGSITLADVTPHEGIELLPLFVAITNNVTITTPLIQSQRAFQWNVLDAVPRVLQINFQVDPLPGAEKTELDDLVDNFVSFETSTLFDQMSRRSNQVPTFATLLGPNIQIATAGAPDGGFKLIDRTVAIEVSDAESQTTDAAYQPKLDTTPTLAAGDYLVTWSVDWSGTSNGTNVSVQVEVDTVQVGLWDDEDVPAANSFRTWSSFTVVTLAAGSRNFSLDFRKESGAGSAIVKNARLTYTRIA